MLHDDPFERGLTWVGRPMELVRIADSVYVDQARHNFQDYVSRTLAASQAVGGRFNPPGEFGALYTATDRETAWEEAAARFRRQGVPGLPPDMGVIGIIVIVGRYAPLTEASAREAWDVPLAALAAEDPTPEEREIGWNIARAVRAVADFLQSPSARANGDNLPLFPDREGSELRMDFQFAEREAVPDHLRQPVTEPW